MKQLVEARSTYASDVAPRRGAWIETPLVSKAYVERMVAPRRGAWIETRSIP